MFGRFFFGFRGASGRLRPSVLGSFPVFYCAEIPKSAVKDRVAAERSLTSRRNLPKGAVIREDGGTCRKALSSKAAFGRLFGDATAASLAAQMENGDALGIAARGRL